MKEYTVIALQTPQGVVGINRRKPPFRGMWNLIGGKVEPDETQQHGAMRETFEETGVELPEAAFDFVGTMDWVIDGQKSGVMYLYLADTDDQLRLPRNTREGILAALEPEWVTLPDNQGVVPDLQPLLPLMLREHGLNLEARYRGDELISVQAK